MQTFDCGIVVFVVTGTLRAVVVVGGGTAELVGLMAGHLTMTKNPWPKE